MNVLEKATLSAEMLRLTRETRDKVGLALFAAPEDQLPLVLDALETAVDAMSAMSDRMLVDVDVDALERSVCA